MAKAVPLREGKYADNIDFGVSDSSSFVFSNKAKAETTKQNPYY